MLAEQLGDPQHEIGGGCPFGEAACEPESDHFREEHVDRLAHHRGLGLDAPDSPAHDAEAIDHGGVAVGPDQAVRVEPLPVVPDHLGQILQIHLMDDPGGGWDHPEVGEGGLTPLEELVTLLVALELLARVDRQGVRTGEGVDLDRMVDYQVDRDQWVHPLRRALITRHRDYGRPHRREIDHRGDTGEVLEHNPSGHERDLGASDAGGVIGGDGGHVGGGHRGTSEMTKGRFQDDLYRIREVLRTFYRVETGYLPGPERSFECGAGPEWIGGHVRRLPRGRESDVQA